MMFEELFSRKKQEKTTERSLPKEIDAIQKVKSGGKKNRYSSMTVDRYVWTNRIIVTCIILVGVVTIGLAAVALIGDFINYSDGTAVNSSSILERAE